MTTLEKMEVATIPIFGIGFFMLSSSLPTWISTGHLLLTMSAMLLLQSLVRDLILLVKMKRKAKGLPTKTARCMCLESTVGLTGVLLGAVVLGVGINQPISMDSWRWTGLIMGVMTTGFSIKDWVIESRPWRVVRDKDHMNITFTWK